jgi:hypothetical protein
LEEYVGPSLGDDKDTASAGDAGIGQAYRAVELKFEDYRFDRVEDGAQSCDSRAVASKPSFADQTGANNSYMQLRRIVVTLPPTPGDTLTTGARSSERVSTTTRE